MYNIEVITFATHNEGLFNQLINNKYNMKIKVLGYGKKWKGFDTKIRGVFDYVNNQDNNKIIVFVDGFDSVVNGSLEDCYKRFLKMNCNVLFSKHKTPFKTSKILNKLSNKKFFNYCYNYITANTGIYMGYVKYLRILLKKILEQKCKDDQFNLNQLCKKYNFIRIDENEQIFKNLTNNDFKNYNIQKEKAIFLQIPGKFSIKRFCIRGAKEYSQFLIKEINVIFILIGLLLLYLKKYKFCLILFILYICFFYYIDKSCLQIFNRP